MDYRYFIIPAVIILLIMILMILFHCKKKAVIKKIKALSPHEKENLLDSLSKPVGYMYEPHQDIFTAGLDAPQKLFGYTTFYDLSAPYFNMIFDYETIYFNYNSRTWLIELWKGQYGINTGCELGIYYTDKIIPPDEYDSTLFKAADTKDMLDITLHLNKHCKKEGKRLVELGHMHDRHWWLTIFKMGIYTKPQDICVDVAIRFKDYLMMHQFLDSFKRTLPDTSYTINGTTIFFSFYHSDRKYSFFKRTVRRIALTACHLYCKWFNYITRPFESSGDKLLYLYHYLPFIIRRMFKPKSKSSK